MRRLNDCQIIYPAPFELPTLRGYPPPPPVARDVSTAEQKRRGTSATYLPPPVRTRSHRRLHDCRFVPNYETAVELVEARRFVCEYDALARAAQPRSRREPSLTSPLAIGLLLAFVPPLAVTLVWSSKHFAHSAKVAITIYGMFTFVALLVAAIFGVHG